MRALSVTLFGFMKLDGTRRRIQKNYDAAIVESEK